MNPQYLHNLAADLHDQGLTLTAKDLRDAANEIEKLRLEIATLKSELNMEKNK